MGHAHLPQPLAALALAGAACLSLAAAAEAQPARTPKQIVDAQLDAAPRMIGAHKGQVASYYGELAKGAKTTHTVTAKELGGLQAVGACDEGCAILEMKMTDPAGAVVGTNLIPDAYPMVYGDVEANVAYTFEVVMTECKQDRCLYGVRIYAKERRKDPFS